MLRLLRFCIHLSPADGCGWVASLIMRTNNRQGPIADIIVGIVGAIIGGYFLSPLFKVGTINQGNFSIPAMFWCHWQVPGYRCPLARHLRIFQLLVNGLQWRKRCVRLPLNFDLARISMHYVPPNYQQAAICQLLMNWFQQFI